MRTRWALSLVLSVVALPVHAQDELAIEVQAGTTAPLDVFVGANVVIAERLLLTTSLGVSVYRRTTDAIARGFGGEESAQIVTPLLFGATVFRLGLGLRPFGNRGPGLLVGYARLMGSADWEAGSFGVPARFGAISANVVINAVYAELGWAIPIGNAFIRPAIGFTRALGTRVSVSAAEANASQSAVANERAGAAVDEALGDFGMTPTISLSLGGRFSFHR